MIHRLLRRRRSACLACCSAAFALACDRDDAAKPSPTSTRTQQSTAVSPPGLALPAVPRPPKILGPLKTPRDNPTTSAKVHLGRKLFFDAALSVDGSRSCHSCHRNEDGTGGHEPTALGAKNTPLLRHAPSLWNVGYLPKLDWDGGSDSLEDQAKRIWAGAAMGVGEEQLAVKAEELGDKADYRPLFAAAFPGLGATPDTVAQALAAYQRTLHCGETAFDRHATGDGSALTTEQRAGMELFIGKGACHSCHTPPFFSDAYVMEDGAYHNVGVGLAGKQHAAVDVGRQKITENPADWAAFKTPSLRHVSRTGPYLHDGSLGSLKEVVRFMAAGGHNNPALDPKMVDKKLSEDEIDQIVAFLGSLECNGRLEPPASL